MNRPLFALLASVIAGISSGYLIEIPDFILITLMTAGLILLIAGLLRRLIMPVILSAVMIILFVISVYHVNFYLYPKLGADHIVRYTGPNVRMVEGVITEAPQVSPEKTTLTVSTCRLLQGGIFIPVEGKIQLNVVTEETYRYGDLIRFKSKLKIPHNFNNPGGFDYERYLRFKRILVHGFINNPANITVMGQNIGQTWKLRLETFRARLKSMIRANAVSPYREIVQAMILGDQKEIPREVMDRFNRTGTSHIIAISGFNVGIIAFFAILLVRLIMKSSAHLMLRFDMVKIASAFSLFPIAIFTFIAGMGISVIRATIMALAFLVAILLGRDRDLYNSLVLAALIILIVSPPSLFDISFQLSFAAVASILYMAPIMTAFIPKPRHEGQTKGAFILHRCWYDVIIFMIVSISATLGTLPLIVYYFNRLSAVTLPANLLVVPIMGIIALPVCMAIILTGPVSTMVTTWLIKLSALLVEISLCLVDFFSSLSWAAFYVPTPKPVEIAAYYLLLIILFELLNHHLRSRLMTEPASFESLPGRRRLLAGSLALWLSFAGVYLAYCAYVKNSERGKLQMTVIDVGQGSSTFLRFPAGKKMLIDGGGFFDDAFDIGQYVVAPYLWHERIRTIDVVVLTHIHPDHLNGLKFIMENFNVKEVWSSGQTSDTDVFQAFAKTIKDKKIPFRLISAASPPLEMDGVHVRIFNPPSPVTDHDESETFEMTNNQSIVIKLTYENIRFFLPADISELTENRLILQKADMKSDVLVVPHHGGLTSNPEAFLDKVLPEIAIISCGKDNIFRLPHPEVIRRLDDRRINVLRTDQDGAITVNTDGRVLHLHSYNERQARLFPKMTAQDFGTVSIN